MKVSPKSQQDWARPKNTNKKKEPMKVSPKSQQDWARPKNTNKKKEPMKALDKKPSDLRLIAKLIGSFDKTKANNAKCRSAKPQWTESAKEELQNLRKKSNVSKKWATTLIHIFVDNSLKDASIVVHCIFLKKWQQEANTQYAAERERSRLTKIKALTLISSKICSSTLKTKPTKIFISLFASTTIRSPLFPLVQNTSEMQAKDSPVEEPLTAWESMVKFTTISPAIFTLRVTLMQLTPNFTSSILSWQTKSDWTIQPTRNS